MLASVLVALLGNGLDACVVLALASPVPPFMAMAGLWLGRGLDTRGLTAADRVFAFDAAMAALLPFLLGLLLFDAVFVGLWGRSVSVLEWLQSWFLFAMSDDLVEGPIERFTWGLMWAALLLAAIAFHRRIVDGLWGLFGYSFGLAISMFITKLLFVDIGIPRLFLDIVLRLVPLPDIPEHWREWLEVVAFRSALVILELGVAGAVWTTARARLASPPGKGAPGFFDAISQDDG